MDSIPTVSIVIPSYNQARFMSEAIRSALDQTFSSFEIIVVDDGSTDDSREVVAGFGTLVHPIFQENKGLGAARNAGILAAKGEFIALLDADDQWQSTFLEKMVALAAQAPHADVYYCKAQAMDAEGSELPQQFGGPPISPETAYQALLRANFLIPSTILVRRSVVVAAGMFEQSIRSIHGCEDWDFWLRLLPEHVFVGTSECLVRYRLHGQNLSADPNRMQQAAQTVIEKHFGSDDGQWHTWSENKRRAYGGLYRYKALTCVQRRQDWQTGIPTLQRALQIDPTLAADLDLFYDLALGNQPAGYRGTSFHLDVPANCAHLESMLKQIFDLSVAPTLRSLRRRAFGTARFAMGLVAYNTGLRTLSRQLLGKAVLCRPELLGDARTLGNILKSMASRSRLERMRALKDRVRRFAIKTKAFQA